MDRQTLYASVTAQVVAQIEAGAGQWRMPWQAIAETGQPVNALTGKPYRGGNHVVLGLVAAANGWGGQWATYRQWRQLGAQVRRGERATHGVKWTVTENEETERRMVPFCFGVFNAAQGAVGTLQDIGGVASGALAGGIIVAAGYDAAFLTLAAIALAGSVLLWVAMPETQPGSGPP